MCQSCFDKPAFDKKDVASVQINPGGSVRKWVQRKHIGSAKMVGDTRGWQQQGARVTGLLRIDRNLVSAILRTSGKRLSTTDGSSSLYDTMTNCLLPLRSCLSQPGLKTKAKVWNKAQQMQKFRLQKLTWA